MHTNVSVEKRCSCNQATVTMAMPQKQGNNHNDGMNHQATVHRSTLGMVVLTETQQIGRIHGQEVRQINKICIMKVVGSRHRSSNNRNHRSTIRHANHSSNGRLLLNQ
jgi:hypothetical protein